MRIGSWLQIDCPFVSLEARGCVIAEDIHAQQPLPPFPASVKDGYAVIGMSHTRETCSCTCLDLAGVCTCLDLAGVCTCLDLAGVCTRLDLASVCFFFQPWMALVTVMFYHLWQLGRW